MQSISSSGIDFNPANLPKEVPVLPTIDCVLFPHMVSPLRISRLPSLSATHESLENGRFILALTQKKDNQTYPKVQDFSRVGTLCFIVKSQRSGESSLKILLNGIARARVSKWEQASPHYKATIEYVENQTVKYSPSQLEHFAKKINAHLQRLIEGGRHLSPQILKIIPEVESAEKLSDLLISVLKIEVPKAQEILEMACGIERLKTIDALLEKEKVFKRNEEEDVSITEDDESDEEDIKLKKAILAKDLPLEVKKECQKSLKRLEKLSAENSEAHQLRTYLETILELPWGEEKNQINSLSFAQKVLDNQHFGLKKVKERILEFLAVLKLKEGRKAPVLCLVGPPGVGKTSLGKSVAAALGRDYVRISLGGVHDESEIRGHRRTYVGAMPGRIVNGFKQSGSLNPLFVLDEIDKLGQNFKGDPSAALLEVLDPIQNKEFRDHYLGLPFDLSKTLFMATANRLDTIPSPLMDRMEVIEIDGYSLDEKIKIAQDFTFPKLVKEHGLEDLAPRISNSLLSLVISEYTREAGLRNLERVLAKLLRKLAFKIAKMEEDGKDPIKRNLQIKPSQMRSFLGPATFINEKSKGQSQIGTIHGLAYTPYGGEVLKIEGKTYPGKGKMILTGQMGDVMQESIQAAKSFVLSRLSQGNNKKKIKDLDELTLHIHVPQAAIPKDGPSAGVAMAAVINSLLLGKSISGNIGITGEISLSGDVLAIGGVREKILAAIRFGLERVLIPKDNLAQAMELPIKSRNKIKISPVTNVEEVFSILF